MDSSCGMSLLLLLLQLGAVSGQRMLTEEEMKREIGLLPYQVPATKAHECLFLEKTADKFSSLAEGRTESFHIDCCGGREFPICGGKKTQYSSRCCPGFVRFQDPITGQQLCNQRVLADKDALAWLKDFASDSTSIRKFVNAFVNTFEAASVLRESSNLTWTVFAVADQGFNSEQLPGFKSAGGCTNDTVEAAVTAAGAADKTEEGTEAHKRAVYTQTCKAFRQNTTADFSNDGWKYLVAGRRYVGDMRKESTLQSQFATEDGAYPLKFSRYSNGISCIECSPILEANHEAANGVVHIIGKEIAVSQASRSVGAQLQLRFADFWSLMDARTQSELGSTGCRTQYTVFVPRSVERLRSLGAEAAAAAASGHVLPGLWCTAGMIDSASQPLVSMATSSLRFACDSSSRRLLQFGDEFRSNVALSDVKGEFDIMAANGVLHVVDAPMLPAAAVTLRSAIGMDSAPAPAAAPDVGDPEAREMLQRLVNECEFEFAASGEHIVLLPTEAAFAKLLHSPAYGSAPEPRLLRRSQRFRCSLLRHHALLMPGSHTAKLSTSAHRQRFYETADGDRLADFLWRRAGEMTAYFMEAKVVGSVEGREFAHGRVYRIDRVLLPSRSPVWVRMRDSLYSQQKPVLREFEKLAAGSESMLTLLLPRRGHRRLLQETALRQHSLLAVFYLSYLPADGETIRFSTVAGGSVRLARKDGQYLAAAAGTEVKLNDCGVRLRNAVICSVDRPLFGQPTDDEDELDAVYFNF